MWATHAIDRVGRQWNHRLRLPAGKYFTCVVHALHGSGQHGIKIGEHMKFNNT